MMGYARGKAFLAEGTAIAKALRQDRSVPSRLKEKQGGQNSQNKVSKRGVGEAREAVRPGFAWPWRPLGGLRLFADPSP